MYGFLKKALLIAFPFYYLQVGIKNIKNQIQQLQVQTELAYREYRKIEAALAFHTAMLDSSGGFVWRKDTEGRYLFANRSMRNGLLVPCMHAIDPAGDLSDQVLEKTDAEILSGSPLSDSERSTFLKTNVIADQYTLQCRQRSEFLELGTVMGRPMMIHTIRTPLFDDAGQLEGIIGFAMDISVGGGDNLLDMVRSREGDGGIVRIHPSVYVLS
jgi:PAS domain-containing protein